MLEVQMQVAWLLSSVVLLQLQLKLLLEEGHGGKGRYYVKH